MYKYFKERRWKKTRQDEWQLHRSQEGMKTLSASQISLPDRWLGPVQVSIEMQFVLISNMNSWNANWHLSQRRHLKDFSVPRGLTNHPPQRPLINLQHRIHRWLNNESLQFATWWREVNLSLRVRFESFLFLQWAWLASSNDDGKSVLRINNLYIRSEASFLPQAAFLHIL